MGLMWFRASDSAWVRIELCAAAYRILRRTGDLAYRNLRGGVSDSAEIPARAGG